MHSKGQDINAFLNTFNRSNYVRVFLSTPVADWHEKAWSATPNESILQFLAICGKHIELVLCTDDSQATLDTAKQVVNFFMQNRVDNLLFEIGNEPLTHKDIKVESLKSLLDSSGYLYSSGIYEDTTRLFGKFGTVHTPRDGDWPRKAKDANDIYGLLKVPWLLDEPIKPNECPQDDNTVKDYYTYGALSGLAGAGALFHYLAGEFGQLPNEFELRCYNAMMDGLDVFPEDSLLDNRYEHLRDLEVVDANGNGTKALRVFRFGSYAIVVRPNNFVAPSNWIPLDSFGVCFKIG